MFQKAHATDRHPLSHVDIAVVVEAGIVRMNELASLPAFRLPTHREVFSQDLRQPHWVVAQVGDHGVGAVKQCDPRVQIRHQHQITTVINGGREQHVVDETEMFALGGKILQPRIGPVSNNQSRFATFSIVPPETMRRAQLTRAFADSTEIADGLCVFVVLDDIVRCFT